MLRAAGLTWAALCSRQARRCPRGFCVRLTGGYASGETANHFRGVFPGQVLRMEFVPRWFRQGVASPHGDVPFDNDDPADDDGFDDPHPGDDWPGHSWVQTAASTTEGGSASHSGYGNCGWETSWRLFRSQAIKWPQADSAHSWDTPLAACGFLVVCVILAAFSRVLSAYHVSGLWGFTVHAFPWDAARVGRVAKWSEGSFAGAFLDGGPLFTSVLPTVLVCLLQGSLLSLSSADMVSGTSHVGSRFPRSLRSLGLWLIVLACLQPAAGVVVLDPTADAAEGAFPLRCQVSCQPTKRPCLASSF